MLTYPPFATVGNDRRCQPVRVGRRKLGVVISQASVMVKPNVDPIDYLLKTYSCIFVSNDGTRVELSEKLKNTLEDSYRIELEDDTSGKLVKVHKHCVELIYKWSSYNVLEWSAELLTELLAWDGLPIGAKDKRVFNCIKDTYPHLPILQAELRTQATTFVSKGKPYTFIHKGFVIDEDFNIYHATVDGTEIYFMLGGIKVSLPTILGYRLNKLQL